MGATLHVGPQGQCRDRAALLTAGAEIEATTARSSSRRGT